MSHPSQHVLITGGNGHLAQGLASAFPQATLTTRQDFDVTDSEAVADYFRTVSPDLLICSAGVADDALLLRCTEASWDAQTDVNLTGAFRCAREALKGMVNAKAGHIVFIGSYSAKHPPAGQSAYASSKAALEGLTRALAREYGPRNIRVNLVLPGFLDSPMTSDLSPARKASVMDTHCLPNVNTSSAVGHFIYTLHHHMLQTSGQTFNLDSRIL